MFRLLSFAILGFIHVVSSFQIVSQIFDGLIFRYEYCDHLKNIHFIDMCKEKLFVKISGSHRHI